MLERPLGYSAGGLLLFSRFMVNNYRARAERATDRLDIDPEAYIDGYRQLSPLGVGFYPIRPDKSPAVKGKLDRAATVHPIKIRYWAEHRHHRSFAARLLRRCRRFVIDTENPFKHPDQPDPNGEMFLGSVLEDSDICLPSCPLVETACYKRGHFDVSLPLIVKIQKLR